MVYEKGDRHLNGWQALDYARQRYIAGGDYARQRHQQQLIRALARKILDEGLARQPERVDQVVAALGDTLVYAGGRRIVDFAYALGGLPADRFTLVGLPGAGVGKGSAYRGEQLTAERPRSSSPSCAPAGPTPTWPPTPAGRQELTRTQSRLGRAGFLVPYSQASKSVVELLAGDPLGQRHELGGGGVAVALLRRPGLAAISKNALSPTATRSACRVIPPRW